LSHCIEGVCKYARDGRNGVRSECFPSFLVLAIYI